MDRIAYDIIAAKRIAEGIQKTSNPSSLTFLKMSSDLGLGISDIENINLKKIDLT